MEMDQTVDAKCIVESRQICKPIHTLIIPSFLSPAKNIDCTAVLPWLQKDLLCAGAQQIGILSAGILPFKDIIRPNRFKNSSVAVEGNTLLVRNYEKAWMPLRFMGPAEKAKHISKLGLEAYDLYFETNGRPDIVCVYDCLYGGLIARKLKQKYGLKYVVTEHRVIRRHGSYRKTLLGFMREVLSGASAFKVIGREVYHELKEEFGDLDVVKCAEVI